MWSVDYAKGHENNAVRALKICRKRPMGTSAVLSAIEWRQPSRLPTTSSGDICMPTCKLHKQKPRQVLVSSGLSHLIKRIVWVRCGRRKSLSRYAQRITYGKGSRNCKNDLYERARKRTLWFWPDIVLWKLFFKSRPDGIVIDKNHHKWMKHAFIISHTRNNLVVLFGTLNVQSFMLTEVKDCDLLIVVTSSIFLKRKDMLKEKST